MGDYYLQSVLIRDDMEFECAKKWSQYYIRNFKRKYYTNTNGWYEFRNIFKKRFSWLKKKHINTRVVLVYGAIKEDDGVQNVRTKKRTKTLPLAESDGGKSGEEMPLQGLSENFFETTENPSPAGICCETGIESTISSMVECRIIEPIVPIVNNNTCRICGQQKKKKEFRKIWSLRTQPTKEIRLWCKTCQKLWKGSRPPPTQEVSFVVDLD